ncbi:MAG: hypothetical protein HY905_20480 [Deltaproteobacteria bacterium]|nr:hypothetical protein [Deltaproteobacteria bacterium]
MVRNREPRATLDRQLLAVANALRSLDPRRLGARDAMLQLGPAPVPLLLVPAFNSPAPER